ncbi:MAG: ribosomal L7Ae/L30e/S12e/Gadd45 family protein [Candidatus Aenigmatarchaeota archaeon]
MEIINKVKEEMQKGNVIYGFRKCLKYLKLNEPKYVIIANNIPENMKKDIIDSVDDKNKIVEVNLSSIELGRSLGKPFPISVAVIKK